MTKPSNKRVCGVGINDADYYVQPTNGSQVCPFYKRWHSMLVRCYSDKYHSPTYSNCKVCDEWLTFSNFKSWMETKYWQGKQLDKDILGDGQWYSPETCCFIESWLNSLFTDHQAASGLYPMGVSLHKVTGKFSATISSHGNRKHLGLFDTVSKAELVYVEAKVDDVKKRIQGYHNPIIKVAVLEKLNEFYALSTC